VAAAAELLRSTRRRHRLSQAALAHRAMTTQAAISRIERGLVDPGVGTLDRLLAAMGERLTLASETPASDDDPAHLAALMRLTPGERVERAVTFAQLAFEVSQAGRRARA
jgi:transcriptional regulator with XRE-family HTH domain